MISTATLGNLVIKIGADASGVAAGVGQAHGALGKLDAGLTRGTVVLARWGAIAAAAAAAAATAVVKSSLDSIDAQSKLARQLGGTIEGVQALERHADLAGLSTEELTKASDRLNKKLGEALRDSYSPTADALARIGLKAKDLAAVDVDERMALIADALKTAGYNAQQTADFLGQLGIRGGKVAALFEEGGDAIRKARDDVRLFGVAVSSFDGKNIERANDAFTVFGLAAKGISNQLAIEFAPVLELIAEHFRSYTKEVGGLGGVVGPVIREMVIGFGVLPSSFHNIRLAWDETVAFVLNGMNEITKRANAARQFNPFAGPAAKEIVHDYGKLRDTIGAAPSMESWGAWWDNLQLQGRLAGITIKSIREAMDGKANPGGAGDDLGRKEREAQEKKFIEFSRGLANEADALRIHHEQQLAQIDEFEKKRIGTAAERNTLRLEAEAEYQRQFSELQQTKMLDDLATEQELEAQKYAKKIEALEMFRAAETDRGAYWDQVQARMHQKHAVDMLAIGAKGYAGLAGIVDTAMGQISGIVADEGEKGFTIMKGIAAATALVKGFEAAVSAYAFGSKIGGPPLGAAMAGVAIAGTAAYIAKLAGVTSGGGGSPTAAGGGGGGGSVPSIAQSADGGGAAAAPVRSAEIGVSGIGVGDLFTDKAVRDLIGRINDAAGDGVLIKVR